MHNCFLSVVGVVNTAEDYQRLPDYLRNVYGVVSKVFSDFEIILVNNLNGRRLDDAIEPLPPELKQQVYVLNLSSPVNRNHAVIAGLDRANGDYTVIFEFAFLHQPQVIEQLYEKTREGYDIVYLRARERKARLGLAYKLFYYILKHYSNLKIDEKAHNTRIISRRALNSLLRLRENLRYMKAIYSIVGYRTAFLPVDVPLTPDPSASFTEKFRTSLVAITSFTTFLRTLLLWIFIGSFLFLVGVVANAVKVKITGVDIFGNPNKALPGWTFLVVLISIFFAVTCLNLYIMSIYLSNIYYEIKHRPLYIIESVQRF